MARDDDEAGGTTTTFAARRPGRAGLRRRPACAGARGRVLSGSKCCRRARARGGGVRALWWRRQRLLRSTRPPRVPTQVERRRKLPGPRRARRTSQHPALLPPPRRACNECGRSELRSGFGGSVKIYRSDIGSCPLSIIPMGQLPPRRPRRGNSAAASAHADGGLCHALSARSNSTANPLRFLPCRLDLSPAVQEIDGLQR